MIPSGIQQEIWTLLRMRKKVILDNGNWVSRGLDQVSGRGTTPTTTTNGVFVCQVISLDFN